MGNGETSFRTGRAPLHRRHWCCKVTYRRPDWVCSVRDKNKTLRAGERGKCGRGTRRRGPNFLYCRRGGRVSSHPLCSLTLELRTWDLCDGRKTPHKAHVKIVAARLAHKSHVSGFGLWEHKKSLAGARHVPLTRSVFSALKDLPALSPLVTSLQLDLCCRATFRQPMRRSGTWIQDQAGMDYSSGCRRGVQDGWQQDQGPKKKRKKKKWGLVCLPSAEKASNEGRDDSPRC